MLCAVVWRFQVLPDALSHAGAAPPAPAADTGRGPRPGVAPPASRHYVQLEAPAISPWCVARLAGVLQDQHQDWDMWLTPEPSTSSLNLPPGAWDSVDSSSGSGSGGPGSRPGAGRWAGAARGGGGERGGGLSPQELQEMVDSMRQLKGQVVSQLSFRQGHLAARLRPG